MTWTAVPPSKDGELLTAGLAADDDSVAVVPVPRPPSLPSPVSLPVVSAGSAESEGDFQLATAAAAVLASARSEEDSGA